MSSPAGPAPLVLWPGALDLPRARWALDSRLTAEPGRLTVTRGGRSRVYDVTGATLERARVPSEDLALRPVVLKRADGSVVCGLDLGEWAFLEVGATPDHRTVGPWLDELTARLAEALGVPDRSSRQTETLTDRVRPDDPQRQRLHVGLMLLLAVLVAGGVILGLRYDVAALLVVAGAACVALGLVGLVPARWWISRRLGSGRRPGPDDGAFVLTTVGQGGWMPFGRAVNAADRALVGTGTIRLCHGRATLVTLPRDEKDEKALAVRPGVSESSDPRATTVEVVRGPDESPLNPGFFAVLQAGVAAFAWPVSPVASLLFLAGALLCTGISVRLAVHPRGRSLR